MLEVGYWDQIIQERMSLAEAQRLAQEEENGRGKRRASRKVFPEMMLMVGGLYRVCKSGESKETA
jgi:hypothetical protein